MPKRPDKQPAHSQTSYFDRAALASLAVLMFAGPLLFFTNLTRNPYFTQISLLYVLISVAGVLWVASGFRRGEFCWPLSGVEKPFLLFLGVAFVSLVYSWITHPALRPGLTFEGLRVWIFTFANSLAAFYFPFLFVRPLSAAGRRLSIWVDIVFAFIWAGLWYKFQAMKSGDPQETIWDSYGAIVWAIGIIYAVVRARKGEAREFIHLTMTVTIVAGLYAILQYAGLDVIWQSPVTPYGGRPVSTFGNPNFLSSYLLLTTVLAAAQALTKEKWEAVGFGLVAMIGGAAVLSTLTRSTYVGLFAALIVLGILIGRSERKSMMLKLGGMGLIFIILLFVFPVTPVTKIQSPLARFTEIAAAAKTGESYGPWHQRLLIWSSAFDMVKQNPLLGNGWGAFELFYPFYQGAYLFNPVYAQWRTHANNAHNILMEIWSQTGTLGLGVALLLFGSLIVAGRNSLRRLSGDNRLIGAALLAGWLGMVVDNFFGNVSIFFAMPAFLFWWNLGLLVSASPASEAPVPSTGSRSRAAALVLGLLFLFTGVYYFSRWREEVWYFQGFRESKMNLIVPSIKSLETAYAWFPGDVNSNYELGNSYARQAKVFSDQGSKEEKENLLNKATWAYSRAIDANPGYDEIYFNRGVTYVQTNHKDIGLRDLQTALLINPLLQSAYGPLSTIYANDKRWADAIAILEQAVRAFPRNTEFWNNLAYVYGQAGEDQKSLAAARKAVELDPFFKTGWLNYKALIDKTKSKDDLAHLPELMTKLSDLINQKQFSAAREPAAELVRLMPDNVDVANSYANILFYLNDVASAIKQYERILQMVPDFEAAHLNLGKIYHVQGNLNLARYHFLRAKDINPTDAEVQAALNSLPK